MGDEVTVHNDAKYEGFENGTAAVNTTGDAPIRFRGKVAFWWYAILVFLLICTCLPLTIGILSIATFFPGAIILIFIAGVFLPIDLFFIDSCIRNHVDLYDSFLKIRVSFFSGTIPYSAINNIKETNSLSASFALSLDRLQIRYMNDNDILIAVKDKEGFFNEVLRRNPRIRIERKGG